MFTIDASNGISITRGDTAGLEITFTGDAPEGNDTVLATLKKSARKDSAIWQKELELTESGVSQSSAFSTYTLELNSEDTLDLPFGSYLWDIRILYSDGQITTPFAPAAFNVLEVVTDLPEAGEEP